MSAAMDRAITPEPDDAPDEPEFDETEDDFDDHADEFGSYRHRFGFGSRRHFSGRPFLKHPCGDA